MKVIFTPSRHFVAALAALGLSACATAPGPNMAVTSTASASNGEVDQIQSMLMQGNVKGGEKQLKTLLKIYPMDARLMLLRQSITGNPTEQLGPVSYSYTVRPADTVETLAERLLGNPLKAYQLARYNGMETPAVLTPGQVMQIPGVEPSLESSAAPARTVKPAPAPRAKIAPVAKPVAAPARPAAQPAAALKARSVGLKALNRGAINEAVSQLQRAHSLDPGNGLILQDLHRAQRIAKTVQKRK